jgi:hypothetical protein
MRRMDLAPGRRCSHSPLLTPSSRPTIPNRTHVLRLSHARAIHGTGLPLCPLVQPAPTRPNCDTHGGRNNAREWSYEGEWGSAKANAIELRSGESTTCWCRCPRDAKAGGALW